MTFRHRAGVSPYSSPFGFAETCVFDKQSLGPFLCGHIPMAPLLPKLRGHFAEFLNNASPAGLRIFSSLTCVGLRYGCMHINSGFSRQCGFMYFATFLHSPSRFRICSGICLRTFPSRLAGSSLSPVTLASCVTTVLYPCSTGLSTCCPSATLLSLTLGPDLPREA